MPTPVMEITEEGQAALQNAALRLISTFRLCGQLGWLEQQVLMEGARGTPDAPRIFEPCCVHLPHNTCQ